MRCAMNIIEITVLSVLGAFLFLFIVAFLYFWVGYRKLKKTQGYVYEAKSDLLKLVRARCEILCKMGNIASTDVIRELKDENGRLMTIDNIAPLAQSFAHFEELWSNVSDGVMAIVKENEQADLCAEFEQMTQKIYQAIEYYNGVNKVYNARCTIFPANCLSKWLKFEKFDYWDNVIQNV